MRCRKQNMCIYIYFVVFFSDREADGNFFSLACLVVRNILSCPRSVYWSLWQDSRKAMQKVLQAWNVLKGAGRPAYDSRILEEATKAGVSTKTTTKPFCSHFCRRISAHIWGCLVLVQFKIGGLGPGVAIQ